VFGSAPLALAGGCGDPDALDGVVGRRLLEGRADRTQEAAGRDHGQSDSHEVNAKLVRIALADEDRLEVSTRSSFT
jgi:hypothetical protein